MFQLRLSITPFDVPSYRNFFKFLIHQCDKLKVCAFPSPTGDIFESLFLPNTVFLDFSLSVMTHIHSVNSYDLSDCSQS